MGEFVWTYQPAKPKTGAKKKSAVGAKPPKASKGKFKTPRPASTKAVLNHFKKLAKKYK